MMTPDIPQVRKDSKYTATQACAILGIHRNTLRNMMLAGRIRPTFSRVGGRCLYSGAEIMRVWRMYRG